MDANCANKIEKFMNTTVRKRDYDYDIDNANYDNGNNISIAHSTSSSYEYYDFDIPQDITDGVCAPNCKNHFDGLFDQCTSDVSINFTKHTL